MIEVERNVANEMASDVVRQLTMLLQPVPRFGIGSVPVKTAAMVFGKSESFVRDGIENGILPIGTVEREAGKSRSNVYISPKLLWEYTGYVWEG